MMATSAEDDYESEVARRVQDMRDQDLREFLFATILRLELAVDRLESLANQPRETGDSSA